MGTLELAVVGLAGSGVGTALGIPMVWPHARRATDVRLMGGWLLAGSIIAGLISARLLGLVPGSAPVEHAINLLGLGAFPLLYLYVCELSGRPVALRRAWWLWTPVAVYSLVLLIRGVFDVGTRVPFAWILPAALGYTALCTSVAFGRQHRHRAALVPARWTVGFLVALNTAQIVRMFFGHLALVPALVPLVMAAGFVGMVGLVVWHALESGSRADAGPAGPRYEKSGLDQEAAQSLAAAIGRALSADRLFADPGLTLGRLASAVGATPHQVSEVLNRHAATSFPDLINRCRVDDVKTQLADPASDRFTIEGIGASAGFGSRSALYAAFRRLEGMTPSEYRARVRAR
jgi:AraC-like DNA-binding protein